MAHNAILYVGVAAPLIEVYRQWLVRIPQCDDEAQRRELLKKFAHHEIGAYGLEGASGASGPEALVFRTSAKVDPERIKKLVHDWSGEDPKQISEGSSVVPTLDHRRYLNQLRGALENQPLRIVQRVGLTLQVLQDDLLALKPALITIFCHGMKNGELVFEDGRGLASYVSGDRVFEAIEPRPQVLFLAACHSEAVLVRAKQAAGWSDCAIVSVDSDSPIEVTAAVEFQARFFRMLLDGKTAVEAIASAKKYVAGSETIGDLTFTAGEKAASEKFRINDAGGRVKLNADASQEAPASFQVAPRRVESRLHRATDRFVGRREEIAEVLRVLLPFPAGLSGAVDHRIVTLTKEGGIGKTSLAGEISGWVYEREFFPGGVFEVSCEEAEGITGPAALLTRLLEVFGVPATEQKGKLMALLRAAVAAALPQGKKGLLVLDNLDHLVGQHVEVDAKRKTHKILETLLTSASELRILATCRWPLGLAHHEAIVPVGPLSEEDSRDVFLSHAMDPTVRLQVKKTWEQETSPIRQLIRLSGRHPQSLELLARHLQRPGMDLTKLRDEAYENLLGVLSDPYTADSDDDRLLKVRRTFELSYRHLSEPAKKLFARLSHLPAGIWCGEMPENFIEWGSLLGDDWKQTIEKELDYYSLGHFEAGPESTSFFRMLPAMVEFSKEKFEAKSDAEWTNRWAQFWQERLGAWKCFVSGKLPDQMSKLALEKRAVAGTQLQSLGVSLFAATQGNWLAVFESARQNDAQLCQSLLLDAAPFLRLTGQKLVARELAAQAVDAARREGLGQTLAAALGALGNVQSALGEREAARGSYEEALAIYRRLAQQHPAAYEPNLATTLNNLGAVQRALGEREAARASYEEALKVRRRLAQQHPAAYEPDVAMTLNNLGNLQSALGEREAARASYEEALKIRRRLAQQHPAAYEPDVATTLNNLGNMQSAVGEREAARGSHEESLKIRRRLAQQHPAAYEPDVATTLNNLGTVQSALGEQAAWRSYEEALKIRRRLAQQHPAAYEPDVATTLNNLGNMQSAVGEREAARGSHEEALKIRRRLAQQHPAAYEPDVATTLNNLGTVQSDLGEWEAARGSCEEALKIRRRLAQQHPAAYEPDVATSLNNLGNLQRDLGEREAARASYEEALKIRRRLAQQHPAAYEPDVAMTLNNLGTVQSDLGEREAARASYEEALKIRRRLAKQHPAAYEADVAMTLNNLGTVQSDLGEGEAARTSFEEALEIYRLLYQKLPQAFGRNFIVALRNYTKLVSESEDDPWWQLRKMFQQGSEGGEEPRAEAARAGD